MKIEEDLTCGFQVLRPQEKVGAFKNSRPKTPIKRGGGWYIWIQYTLINYIQNNKIQIIME